MKQFYKIGEISKLYQIGPDSLRYYEELGLLNPTRGENGYRMYGLNDLWRLNVIRDLRKLNFPMEKIASYIRSRSWYFLCIPWWMVFSWRVEYLRWR